MSSNSYKAIIQSIFDSKYEPDCERIEFERHEIQDAAEELGVATPKNLGDVVYATKHRIGIPEEINALAPEGKEWEILQAGKAKYQFVLVNIFILTPNPSLIPIKIPAATPALVRRHALSDEQALLAILRYNRLIDLHLGLCCHSLQNHLRTTVHGIGQIEIDEIYVGLDSSGIEHIIPVQAKGGNDKPSRAQVHQDTAFCLAKYPNLKPHAISAQFLDDSTVVIFEVAIDEAHSCEIVSEQHYRLVPE